MKRFCASSASASRRSHGRARITLATFDYVQQGDLALLVGVTFDLHGRHVGHSPEVSFAPLAMILGRCPPRRMRERGGSERVRGGFSGKQGFQSFVMK